MLDATISWLSVIVATAVAMAISFAWYSKSLFGSRWQKLVGLKDKDMKKGMVTAMVRSTILTLITAFFLAKLTASLQNVTWLDGAVTGLWVWFAFVMTTALTNTMYQRRGKRLFAITSGYYLVTFVVMGAIVAAWK